MAHPKSPKTTTRLSRCEEARAAKRKSPASRSRSSVRTKKPRSRSCKRQDCKRTRQCSAKREGSKEAKRRKSTVEIDLTHDDALRVVQPGIQSLQAKPSLTSNSNLMAECRKELNNPELYMIIGVNKHAEHDVLLRGYFQHALRYHPDKHIGDNETFTRRFQLVSRVYALLSNDQQRLAYDLHGIVHEDKSITDWIAYFNRMVQSHRSEYLNVYSGSSEEKHDLIRLYGQHKGDWSKISTDLISHTIESESRLRRVIDSAIQVQEVPRYEAETTRATRRRSQSAARSSTGSPAMEDASSKQDEVKKVREIGKKLQAIAKNVVSKQRNRRSSSIRK